MNGMSYLVIHLPPSSQSYSRRMWAVLRFWMYSQVEASGVRKRFCVWALPEICKGPKRSVAPACRGETPTPPATKPARTTSVQFLPSTSGGFGVTAHLPGRLPGRDQSWVRFAARSKGRRLSRYRGREERGEVAREIDTALLGHNLRPQVSRDPAARSR